MLTNPAILNLLNKYWYTFNKNQLSKDDYINYKLLIYKAIFQDFNYEQHYKVSKHLFIYFIF